MVQIEMEETLHNYLRRHFERISKNKARQLAEQTAAAEADVIPDTRVGHKSLPVMDVEGGLDPKLETLKIGTNCSERRFGWQSEYSVWSFAAPLPSGF